MTCPECGSERWTRTTEETQTVVAYLEDDRAWKTAMDPTVITPSWWICGEGHDASEEMADRLTERWGEEMTIGTTRKRPTYTYRTTGRRTLDGPS